MPSQARPQTASANPASALRVPHDAGRVASTDLSPDDIRYHYRVIERAIALIDAQHGAVSLDSLAAGLRMSPSHFQRVFSRWVGVSPKRYQQYLSLGQAKALLARRATLLDTAAETGLSGTGRLHDLFVTWEAMSPGDYARAGEGLTIRYATAPSPFGDTLAMATERGLCGMAFVDGEDPAAAFADLSARWPRATYLHDPAAVVPLAEAAFRAGGNARLHLIGAPFQIKVWEALLQVPSGQVTTYSDIARAIGSPRAVRAVGTAVGRNPISWLIPCHRALRLDGALGGYHWGLPRKRAMLAWESARADSEPAQRADTQRHAG